MAGFFTEGALSPRRGNGELWRGSSSWSGSSLYVLGAWLVVTGRIRVALLVAALGFILRRRVKAVAPQLAERMGTDLFLEDAEGERD